MGATDRKDDPDYKVGYKCPPRETQFKPGQRANPKGRRRGSKNRNTYIKRGLEKKIKVREGDKTRKVPGVQAVVETHVLKAAQGDHRSSHTVYQFCQLLEKRDGASGSKVELAVANSAAAAGPPTNVRPSDAHVECVDPTLLSKDEQVELSRLAERIDEAGGDLTELETDDFQRLKEIKAKGMRKDAIPEVDPPIPEIT